MEKIVLCADVIAKLGESFVVVERLSSLRGLAFPGGKVDAGETELEAVKREFFEETGLVLTMEGFLGLYGKPGRDPRGNYVSTVFHGVAMGVPKAEAGKTRVLLLSRNEVEARAAEFVADHFKMFVDYCFKCL